MTKRKTYVLCARENFWTPEVIRWRYQKICWREEEHVLQIIILAEVEKGLSWLLFKVCPFQRMQFRQALVISKVFMRRKEWVMF